MNSLQDFLDAVESSGAKCMIEPTGFGSVQISLRLEIGRKIIGELARVKYDMILSNDFSAIETLFENFKKRKEAEGI